MSTDKLTKVLLTAIATALWIIALNPWLKPTPVAAQDYIDLSTLESYVSSIVSDVSSIDSAISSIRGSVSFIESDVDDIDDGSCSNSTICC